MSENHKNKNETSQKDKKGKTPSYSLYKKDERGANEKLLNPDDNMTNKEDESKEPKSIDPNEKQGFPNREDKQIRENKHVNAENNKDIRKSSEINKKN